MKKNISFRVSKVKASKKGLILEGYANLAKRPNGEVIIDRGGEYVPPSEWKLDEWLENPQVLFEHNPEFPIGRGLDAKVTKDGLWVRVLISNSSDPEISRIRDLIEEGILQTFSVGFNCKEERTQGGVIICRNAIVFEISVVSVPMNQGSFFKIATKSYLATTSLDQIREDIMKLKGAVSAKVQEKIAAMTAENRFEPEAFVAQAVALSKHTQEEVEAAMSGEGAASVPTGILGAFADLLGIPGEELRAANEEDVSAALDNKSPETDDDALEDQPEVPEATEQGTADSELAEDTDEKTKAKDPKEEKPAAQKPGEKPGDVEPAEELEDAPADPETKPEDEELENPHAKTASGLVEKALDALAKGGDHKTVMASLMADYHKACEEEAKPKPAKGKKADARTKAFTEMVLDPIAAMVESGKDQDDAIHACLKKFTKHTKGAPLYDGDWQEIYKAADKGRVSRKEKHLAVVPGDIDQGQAGTAAQQQTNILLAQVIIELQLLRKNLSNLPAQQTQVAAEKALDPAPAPAREPELNPEEEALKAKCLDNMTRLKNNIVEKLKGQG